MALSGSLNTSTWYGQEQNGALKFSWTATQTIASNSSKLSWTLTGVVNEAWIMAGGFKVVIDGDTEYSKDTDYRIKLYNGTVVASGTKTLTHKADGTRQFSVSVQAGIYTYAVNVTGSKTFTLDTIDAVSDPTVSASSVQMGNKVTINTNRKSSSLTHNLTYSFGGATGTIANGVGASYEWTVPDLVSKISGKTSGTCTITCKTYSGATYIGSDTVSLTLTIPAKSTPSASASTVQMGNKVTINTNRKSTGFTHTLTYAIGNGSGTIATGVEGSREWTPPKSLAAYTGNKTSAVCTITCNTYNGSLLVGTATCTITLTVPDATVPTLSATTVAMGSLVTISMPKEADVYTHDLSYTFHGVTGTITNGASADVQWTVPLSLAAEIPSDTEGTVTITCKTRFKDSTTVVGTESVSFTATVPNNSTTQPKVTMTATAVDTPFSGVFVAGKSKVKVSYDASSDYSTIKSYLTELLGDKDSTNPYTSAVLTNAGTVDVYGKVTDARGYYTEKTSKITVIEYSRPRIIPGDGKSNIVCTRCNSDGNADPGGVYLRIQIGRKYWKVVSDGVQKNFCKLSYQWKSDAADDYSAPVELLAKNATTDYVDVCLPGIVTSNTTAYNIRLIAEDDVGETDDVTITVPTAFATWHVPEGGHGFTLGGYHDPAKYNVFDCWFDAEFHGEVHGIYSQGETDGWYWRKYSDGIAECWRRVSNGSRAITTQTGSMYYATCDEVTFPFSFTDAPAVTATVESSTMLSLFANGNATPSKPASYRVICPTTIAGASFTIAYHAIGRWKE